MTRSTSMPPAFEIHRVAERALLVRFLDDDLARAVARSSAVFSFLSRPPDMEADGHGESVDQQKISRRAEWIPGAGNLLLRVEDSAADAQVRLEDFLRTFPFRGAAPGGRSVEATVRFGGPDGEDLPAVARETELSEAEVVARLCGAELTVAFVGFSPGFPYLVGLPPELEVPRLAKPRTKVPAGSVAIAGPFAGIYPAATPGGWRLVGRTDLALFDATSSPPAFLAPGDRIRFVAG